MTSPAPQAVPGDYASEQGLEARRAAYRDATGPDAREVAFEAVAEVRPRRFLEVGCGPGELAARVQADLGSEVVAVDSSPRMVELARGRGVAAQVGDVQELPFADASFDCALAAWMLYHVPDVPKALTELARVLRPGGRLVAVTNRTDHLQELRELVGAPPRRPTTFPGERGRELLAEHFARVEEVDASGTVTFRDRAAVEAYVGASRAMLGDAEVPELREPLVVRRRPVVFVAETRR